MRRALLLACLVAIAAPETERAAAQEVSRIEGTVVDAISGEPVWAEVSVLPAASRRSSREFPAAVASGVGRFMIAVEPGAYDVQICSIGYRCTTARVTADSSVLGAEIFALEVPWSISTDAARQLLRVLEEKQALWESSGVRSYELHYTLECPGACIGGPARVQRIRVIDGVGPPDGITIETIFRMVRRDIRSRIHQTTIEYDEDLGFPRRYESDVPFATDSHYRFGVLYFRPLR